MWAESSARNTKGSKTRKLARLRRELSRAVAGVISSWIGWARCLPQKYRLSAFGRGYCGNGVLGTRWALSPIFGGAFKTQPVPCAPVRV